MAFEIRWANKKSSKRDEKIYIRMNKRKYINKV